MKFNKAVTIDKSPLEGLAVYREELAAGRLKSVSLRLSNLKERRGIWRREGVENIAFRERPDAVPLETEGFVLKPRAPVVDELTRHKHTAQVFVPIDGPIAAVVGASTKDGNNPDANSLELVPVQPGEAIWVEAGTWHTLPFTFVSPVRCLSVMYRDDLDSYHDVRDLVAAGWIGLPAWND